MVSRGVTTCPTYPLRGLPCMPWRCRGGAVAVPWRKEEQDGNMLKHCIPHAFYKLFKGARSLPSRILTTRVVPHPFSVNSCGTPPIPVKLCLYKLSIRFLRELVPFPFRIPADFILPREDERSSRGEIISYASFGNIRRHCKSSLRMHWMNPWQ